MRKAKKLIGILLTLAMVLSMSTAALAASGSDTTGSITITSAEEGETYSIYQIFDLTYADDGSSYSYTVVSAWSDFIENYTYTNSSGETVYLFSLDSNGSLEVDSNVFSEQDNSDVMSAFAQAALAYAETNGISASATQTADDSGTVVFEGLNLGYYLVSTTLGSLCFLDSTNPDASIAEKNPTPWPDKEEYDDETDDEYTKEDTAEVGDTISYKIFLYDVAHSVNLCMHDTMTDGLTFTKGSVKVSVGYPDPNIEDLFNDDTTIWTQLTDGVEYTEEDSCGDDCAFELSFDDEWLDSLSSGAVIMVTYDAIVNENAIDENNLWAIQHNDVVLTYGSAGMSTHAETFTETTGFNILKYTDENGEEITLEGAEFELYRDAEHTDIVYFIPISESGAVVGYEEVDPSDYTGTGTPTTTIVAGNVYVKGLHAGTYYLVETKAPDGYNMLTDDVVINIEVSGSEEEETVSETVTVDGEETDDQTARVLNNQGSILPGTGGMGTTIFYVIGVILVLGAAILLVTKRRMNNAQ